MLQFGVDISNDKECKNLDCSGYLIRADISEYWEHEHSLGGPIPPGHIVMGASVQPGESGEKLHPRSILHFPIRKYTINNIDNSGFAETWRSGIQGVLTVSKKREGKIGYEVICLRTFNMREPERVK